MKTTITFRHLDASDAVKERVRELLTKLDKHFPRNAEAHAVLTGEKHRHKVELTLQAPNLNLVASAETDDLYAAVDEAVDVLKRQVRKAREKTVERRAAGAKKEPAVTPTDGAPTV